MKLNLEFSAHDGVTIVCCSGRIAYRDEAVLLSEKVAEWLRHSRQLVLELSAVDLVDAAGLGELVGIYTWGRACGVAVSLVNPQPQVRRLLELTGLAAVVRIHASLAEAVPGAGPWLNPRSLAGSSTGSWRFPHALD